MFPPPLVGYFMNLLLNLGDFINQFFRDNNLNINPLVGESIAAAIIFFLTLFAGWVTYHIFEHYFSKWAKKTKTVIDDEIIKNTKRPIYFFVIIVGFYYAVQQLTILIPHQYIIKQIFLVAEVFLVAYIITRIINVLLSWYAERIVKTRKKALSSNILRVFKNILHVFVYIFALLYLLYVSKINLSGALVGLGVTGIAIAFALQNILGDLFSAFTIYFGRPFEIGDYIIIGDDGGTVTKIGLRSTRIQLLEGEEMIISNREITSGKVRNLQKMPRRRVEFIIRVSPNVQLKKLKKVSSVLKETVENCKPAEFNMVHLREVGPFSYNFEVVYYLNTGDYEQYLDVHDRVIFAIRERFEKEGIDFGFQGSRQSSST
jgi:small-conductance mechanosensitive channel